MPGFWRTSAWLCATTGTASSSSHCCRALAYSWLRGGSRANSENCLTWASLRQGRDYWIIVAFPADGSERHPGLSPSLFWLCRTRTTSHSVGAHGSRTTIPLTAGRGQEAGPFSKIGCFGHAGFLFAPPGPSGHH